MESIFTKISRLKQNEDPTMRFRILINDPNGLDLGTLVCVDKSTAHDPKVIHDLTRWRNRYMRYFFTQFEATDERTAAWLNKIVIPSRDRILFLIYTNQGEAIGNLGICNMCVEMGEIDNLIRGQKRRGSHIAFFSVLAMLNWMFCSLGMKRANLHVFSNNTRAIRLLESAGFSIHKLIRLSRKVISNEIHYLINADDGESVDFQCGEMLLSKETFYCMHPWIMACPKINP